MRLGSLIDKEKFTQALIPFAAGALAYGALQELNTDVLDYGMYRHMFRWLPSWAVFARYCLSIFDRELLLLGVVLVLLHQELGRKIVVFLSYVMIVTVYWKHPYEAIVSINQYYRTNMDEFLWTIHLPWAPQQPVYPLMMLRTANFCFEDLLIGVITVMFFSSSAVKKYFR